MKKVKIVEVGPRDGLQNEPATVPAEVKVAFVDALSSTGVGEIEVSAFVSPRRVPQLQDADEVFSRITRREGVVYSALVPNQRGLERALAAGVDKISVFTAASETFNRKNINASGKEVLERFRPVVRGARQQKLPVRGYVSTAYWCAYEGRISPEATFGVVQNLFDIGVEEVSISDTIGKATPEQVSKLFDILLPGIAPERVAVHFHDTYGRGVDNVLTSLSYGIRVFDASCGGIGGCPFAPGATGNVATEAVVKALEEKKEPVGVDLDKLSLARRTLDPYLTRDRRAVPEGGSQACMACKFYRSDVCCRLRREQI